MKTSLSTYFTKPKQEDKNSKEFIDHSYKYWRVRIFTSMYFGYVVFYFTRKSFTFAMPALMEELSFDKADLGILASILYLSYGVSKFVSGILSDKFNPRYFMSLGLIATGLTNICFASSSSLFLFGVFWCLNGFFQGWGFPPVAKQLTYWISRTERGLWWSIMSTANNLGGALIPLLVALILTSMNWRWAMYIPAIISLVMGILLLINVRDIPTKLGLPNVEKYKDEPEEHFEENSKDEAESKPSIKDAILNKPIMYLAIACFFVYVIRTGVNDWIVLYLHQVNLFSSSLF